MKENDYIIKNKNIKDIEEEFNKLYNSAINTYMPYCLTYSWILSWHKYTQGNIVKKLGFGTAKYICTYDYNNDLVLIIPIIIRKNNAHILCLNSAIDYYDFIYGDAINSEILKASFRYLKEKLNIKMINIPGLSCKSRTNELLAEIDDIIIDYQDIIPSLELRYNYDSFEEYFDTLSKSMRQNIRTAYNRIRTDGLKYNMEYVKGKIDKPTATAVIQLHQLRVKSKYPLVKTGFQNGKIYLFIKNSFVANMVKTVSY